MCSRRILFLLLPMKQHNLFILVWTCFGVLLLLIWQLKWLNEILNVFYDWYFLLNKISGCFLTLDFIWLCEKKETYNKVWLVNNQKFYQILLFSGSVLPRLTEYRCELIRPTRYFRAGKQTNSRKLQNWVKGFYFQGWYANIRNYVMSVVGYDTIFTFHKVWPGNNMFRRKKLIKITLYCRHV